MSLAATNISVEAALIAGDVLWAVVVVIAGITFSLRDLSTRALLAVEEELAEDDDDVDREVKFVANATEIFDRTPSPLWPAGGLGLLLLLPLLLLMFALALSASFSWHIIFNRRLMGVDSGPKKSEMVLERVFRNASCLLRADFCWDGGLRWRPPLLATANADGVGCCCC